MPKIFSFNTDTSIKVLPDIEQVFRAALRWDHHHFFAQQQDLDLQPFSYFSTPKRHTISSLLSMKQNMPRGLGTIFSHLRLRHTSKLHLFCFHTFVVKTCPKNIQVDQVGFYAHRTLLLSQRRNLKIRTQVIVLAKHRKSLPGQWSNIVCQTFKLCPSRNVLMFGHAMLAVKHLKFVDKVKFFTV